MNKLVLFDIDRTLLIGDGSGHPRFSKAFKEVYGVDTDINVIDHHGMTDKQIIIEVLKKNGLDESIIKSKLESCADRTVDFFKENIGSQKIILLDGVEELLERLLKDGVFLGLVTGNLEPIARSKLEKVGISDYFKVGGFGSDDINRANLVKIAIKRAEENFNSKFDVFLVGDTPRDILAGKEAQVRTIGVATGIHSLEQLENSGADFVLEDLKDTNKIMGIILK
ncbi:MAG: HAD family hydrolase [bacterium]|nr:HAD family hydrolase [bacterium]